MAQIELTGNSYRLFKIGEIQKQLEQEREKREGLSRKYHRGVKAVNNIGVALVALTMGLGVAGVSLLSTIVGIPIVIVMEGIAISSGLLSIVGKYVNTKLTKKAEKHEKIKTLAEAKLNTISTALSKALDDNEVSDAEFKLILDELDKFREMKDALRRKLRRKSRIDNEVKNEDENEVKRR